MPPSQAVRERVARLAREPGVYLWKDKAGTVVYVGKAADLRSRVSSYLDPQTDKTAALMQEAADLDFLVVRNEKEALLLEQTLIKRHRPKYNVRLNDDKQYPYLKLTREEYPRLLKVHRREDDGATYFGPFPDGSGAWHVLQALQDIVPLRRCRVLPKEKCLYYDIGKCIAPCIAACTDEEYDLLVAEVRDLLQGRADHLLAGVRQRMEAAAAAQRFEEAARLRDQLAGLQNVLERQHVVQDRLEDRDVAAMAAHGELALVVVLHQRGGLIVGQSPFAVAGVAPGAEGQALADFLRGYFSDRPVPRYVTLDAAEEVAPGLESDLRLLRGGAVTVETPQRGGKRRWIDVALTNARLRLEEELHRRNRRGTGALEAVQRHLGLAAPPRIIEGFDISHLAGQHTRAALVRFVDGEPDKSGYRTFNMRTVGEAAVAAGTAPSKGAGREVDDPASIGEAVARRYAKAAEEARELPHLVLVDGGPTQLAAARAALAGLGLLHVSVASLAKEEELVFQPSRIAPLRLKRTDPGLQLLQRVRDEAHRFGIRQVRSKGTQAVTSSPLDDVPGIGPKRRAELVRMFGGLEGLRSAQVEDLVKVRGVTAEVARAILAVLRPDDDARPVAGAATPVA